MEVFTEVRGGLHGGPWRSVEVSTEVHGGPWMYLDGGLNYVNMRYIFSY